MSMDMASDHLEERASAKDFNEQLLLAVDFCEEAASVAGCARFSCRRNPVKVVKDREQTEQACLV
ncbi:hypothetical protein T08_12351 [Trichinella sp. T8]|nr:hypothetical protein T08_12351 [Trichinella sp. T8]